LSIPLILAQTSNTYLETFDSGNAEGWAFYTGASVSVQNGQLNVVSSGTDFQIAHIYPPIGATINDFSIEITSDPGSLADGGFLGRNGFNSLIGLLFEDDTVHVVHAENVTNYMDPPFVYLSSIRLFDYSAKAKFSAQKSGSSIIVSAWINDTLRYSGTILNSPAELLKGNLIISLVGDELDYQLNEVKMQYNPYIVDQTGTYNDTFDDPSSPWLKMGTWESVASSITINNGTLKFDYIGSGSSLTSLYTGTPLGAVKNYEISLSGGGHMNDGMFGLWRIYSYNYYTGFWIEDDVLKIGYLDGNGFEPITVSSTPISPQGITWLKFVTNNFGNSVQMSVYADNLLLLNGNFDSPDTRLHSGHLAFGVDVRDTVNMAYNEVSIVYNKFVTDVNDETIPSGFALQQNYPNPFNPSTVIEYELMKGAVVKLEVFDILGRKCLTLVDQFQTVGKHMVSFDGVELSGGVYFYRLTADGFVQSRKMVLLR
jgi:hypothetical protein